MKTGIGHIAVCSHGSLGIICEVAEDDKSGTIIEWIGKKSDGSKWRSNNPRFLDKTSEKIIMHIFEGVK